MSPKNGGLQPIRMVSAPVVMPFNSSASVEYNEALKLSKRTKQKLDKILFTPSEDDKIMETIQEVADSSKVKSSEKVKVHSMRQVTTYSMESDSSQGERIMVSLESDAESEKSVSDASEGQPGHQTKTELPKFIETKNTSGDSPRGAAECTFGSDLELLRL